jgi:hypothetical protein
VRTIGPGLKRGTAFGAVGIVVASVGVVGGWGTAHAERAGGSSPPGGQVKPPSVVLRASAQGVRMAYTIPNYVVVSQVFDGGGPVTQSEADSTGRATSFSALPYPGENAIAAPGVLSVALGRSVPLVYPFYVRADYPTTPSAELKDPSGSYSLTARADDGSAGSTGLFQGPGGVSGTRSTTSTVLDDHGVVRAVAESVSTGISVGNGALRIASVTTRSETTLRADDATPKTVASLLVEGASVAGHPVTIDATGVHAEQQTVPAPVGQGITTDNQVLGQAGVSARVVPAGVPGGAEALVITSSQTFPAPGNPKGTVVMTFGGAVSEITVGSADGAAAADTPPAHTGDDARPDTGGPTLPPAAASAAGPSAGAGIPASPAPAGPGATPIADAATLSSALTLNAGPEAALPVSNVGSSEVAAGGRGVPVQGVAGVRVEPDLGTTGALYALLGMGGVALAGATRLLRWRGARR